MKKRLALMLAAAMAAGALSGCGGGASSQDAIEKYGSDTLKIFNWGEYIGTDVVSDFEDEFGVKVIYETFDSNEMMYTKVSSGDKYDILVPSDYMIQRMMREDMLQPLDLSYIPNFDLLVDEVVGLPYDENNEYSVPYFWGTVGIVYNKNTVSDSDLEAQGWEILRNTKYKGRIYMYDSERDSFMVALKALGYSMNTDNEDEINEAYKWLCDQRDTMDPIYVTDEVIDNMANGMMDMAVVYSGDAAYILEENEDMGYYMPNEGTNIWSDAMVIPKNAENPKLAHEFINYILTYDASYANTEEVGYVTTQSEVYTDVTADDGMFADNEAYPIRTDNEKDEVFEDNETIRAILSELWLKVKA
ncbi:MAG: ABC transporter substrate-binding protein, partial [Butyricicoccaceae bacterium]